MNNLKIFGVLFLVQLVLVSPVFSLSEPVVSVDGDRISLQADYVPLFEIVEKLREQGIRVRVEEGIDPDISANITNRLITNVLTGLLKPYSFALVWEKVVSPEGDKIQLAEIQIFHTNKEGLGRSGSKNTLDIVHSEDGSSYVANIVMLRVKPTLSKEVLNRLLMQYNAKVIDYHKGLGIIRLQLPKGSDVQQLASELSDNATVDAAEPDYAYSLPPDMKATSQPDVDTVPPVLNKEAEGIPIAVLDSGLATEYADSPFLLGSYDALSPGNEISDSAGHGTQMTLIAAGAVNPIGSEGETEYNNPVVAVRVFDDNGYTSNSTLIRGIDYAISTGAKVLSMSWGSESDSTILASAIDYAAENGLIIVAAAGNAPTGEPVYPAAYQNVIGVGASMPDGEPWEQSNYGDFVSVEAPGFATFPVGHKGPPGTYAGTSISTAYASREFAQLLENNPDLNQEALLENLPEQEE